MKISFTTTRKTITVFFGNTLHLRLPRTGVVVHSWIDLFDGNDANFPSQCKFCIEYHLEDGRRILTEYAERKVWELILGEMAVVLMD